MIDILEDPNYFECEKTHCKLKLAICIGRQKANQQRKKFEPTPYPECEKCGQGKKNMGLASCQIESGSPRRGHGERNEKCSRYDDCLSYVASRGWKTFNCESCEEDKNERGEMIEPQKRENDRICEECKSRPTIQPNSKLCSRCLAKRAKRKKMTPIAVRDATKGQGEALDKDRGEISSPGGDVTLIISFERYPTILERVKSFAEEDMRPINLQVIYMLKKYLGQKESPPK